MTPSEAYELATTVRWLVDNKWTDPEAQAEASKGMDKIVEECLAMCMRRVEPFTEGGGTVTATVGGDVSAPPEINPIAQAINRPFRVALVVGHNKRQPGADMRDVSEFVFNGRVVDAIVRKGLEGVTFKKFERIYSGSYWREIDNVYADVRAFEPDFAVELHFNADGSRQRSACVLVADGASAETTKVARALLGAFVTGFDVPDGGLVERSRGERGGRSLWAIRQPSVITEPFFGDNAATAEKILSIGPDGVADVYIQGIRNAIAALR